MRGRRTPDAVASKWHDMTAKTFECMRMEGVTGGAGDVDEYKSGATGKNVTPSALQKWKETEMWEILSDL
jgi:hypothetical protein